MKIDPAVALLLGEIISTRRRVSAFSGRDLEVVLREQGVQHLMLAGVLTGGKTALAALVKSLIQLYMSRADFTSVARYPA